VEDQLVIEVVQEEQVVLEKQNLQLHLTLQVLYVDTELQEIESQSQQQVFQ
jgi:hypothetical protein